jgi:hypothetical protein
MVLHFELMVNGLPGHWLVAKVSWLTYHERIWRTLMRLRTACSPIPVHFLPGAMLAYQLRELYDWVGFGLFLVDMNDTRTT